MWEVIDEWFEIEDPVLAAAPEWTDEEWLRYKLLQEERGESECPEDFLKEIPGYFCRN